MEPNIKVQPSAQKNMKKPVSFMFVAPFVGEKKMCLYRYLFIHIYIFIFIYIYMDMYIEYLNPYDPHMAYVPLHLVDFYAKCR